MGQAAGCRWQVAGRRGRARRPTPLASPLPPAHHHLPPSRRGLGLAELLLALAVTAALLAAVAVAVRAAAMSYAANQSAADLDRRARLTMDRLTSAVRAARDHAPLSPARRAEFADGRRVDDAGVSMFDAAGRDLTFFLDPARRVVMLRVDGGDAHELARDVSAFAVTLEPMRSPAAVRTGGGFDRLRRATVTLTVDAAPLPGEAGGRRRTYSASVAPRANVW